MSAMETSASYPENDNVDCEGTSTRRRGLTLFLKNGHDSVSHPLERFPFEIWSKIFSYSLLTSEDLSNCYKATPQMHQAFASEFKCAVFLPKILEILSEPRPKKTLRRSKSGKVLIYATDSGYLSDRDVYKLRLVSPCWSDVVHRFISNHPSQFRLEELPRQEYTLLGDRSTEFESSLTLPHLNKMYDYCPFTCRFIYPDNPSNKSFTTRRILIRDPVLFQEHLKRRYWDELDFILKQIGNNIWHCKFIITQAIPINTRYQRIVKFLGYMPNLKTLEIWDNAPIQEECKLIQDLSKRKPCPLLPQLVLLKVDNMSHQIFNEILAKNSHLSKLSIERHGTCCSGNGYDLTPLTNLSELSLSLYKRDDIKILDHACFRSWPLHTLSVHFENDLLMTSQNQWLPWDQLFDVLERFGGTVEALKLKLPRATFFSEKKSILRISSEMRLNMPHVKTLRLVVPNTASIDFLLPMRDSLESLKILIDHCEDTDEDYLRSMVKLANEDIITFHGCLDSLETSNIWDIFPKIGGSLDVGKRQTEKSLNIYFREDFKIYSYMEKKLVATNGYYFI